MCWNIWCDRKSYKNLKFWRQLNKTLTCFQIHNKSPMSVSCFSPSPQLQSKGNTDAREWRTQHQLAAIMNARCVPCTDAGKSSALQQWVRETRRSVSTRYKSLQRGAADDWASLSIARAASQGYQTTDSERQYCWSKCQTKDLVRCRVSMQVMAQLKQKKNTRRQLTFI